MKKIYNLICSFFDTSDGKGEVTKRRLDEKGNRTGDSSVHSDDEDREIDVTDETNFSQVMKIILL